MGTTLREDYTGGEVLADQTGAGNVLTFEFQNPVYLVVVQATGGDARVNPFRNGNPTANLGVRADDGIPTYIPVYTDIVLVFAPVDVVVTVYGLTRE